jgi:hypothetical protein
MREPMKTNQAKMDAKIDANQEKTDVNLKAIIAEMRARRKRRQPAK